MEVSIKRMLAASLLALNILVVAIPAAAMDAHLLSGHANDPHLPASMRRRELQAQAALVHTPERVS